MTPEQEEQAAVLAWLRAGAAWAGEAPAEEVTTHAARIFLVGARAFKMKRAVRYSFLDFTTLERRRAALEAELELNRRTAPMLYHRVLAVTAADGGLELDGPGEPVEWLLEMSRFDQAARLDRIAERGPLDGALIDALAEAIADLHDHAAIRIEASGHRTIAAVVDGNAGDLDGLVAHVLPEDRVHRLVDATVRELERGRAVLDDRAARGLVRHGHGDLHLANIVLLEGQPVLFDCLEFDPALATTDTLYDLAFLLMDLVHRDQGAAAARLLGIYLERREDDAGLALLPLFLAVRATIRAKVEGFEAVEQPEPHREAARRYLERALGFLERRPRPRLIAIGGLSGTGKSSVARALAPELGPAPGAVVVRSDGTRKRLLGRRPTERLEPAAYGEEVSARVFEQVARRAETLLRAGHGVVADAVFLRPGQRERIEHAARMAGAAFQGLWLEAPFDLIRRRVEARRADASDATAAVVRMQLGQDPGPIGWTRLRADRPLEDVVRAARRALSPG